MPRQIALDDRQHPVEVNWFVDARYSAHPPRLLVCCGTGTDDYDRDSCQPWVGREKAAERLSAQLRHHEIQQDEGGRRASNGVEGFESIARGPDRYVVIGEVDGDHLSRFRVILDDEDVCRVLPDWLLR